MPRNINAGTLRQKLDEKYTTFSLKNILIPKKAITDNLQLHRDVRTLSQAKSVTENTFYH